MAPSKPWVTSAVLSTARAHGRAISFTVTTVQRVRTPEGKEHLQDGGLPVQKGGSLASPHLPAHPSSATPRDEMLFSAGEVRG